MRLNLLQLCRACGRRRSPGGLEKPWVRLRGCCTVLEVLLPAVACVGGALRRVTDFDVAPGVGKGAIRVL